MTGRLPDKTAVARIDVTRLQRAPEGSRQSAAGSSDDVIKRGRAFGISGSGDAVVLGDLVVNAEVDRLALTRYLRAAQRPANAFDPHPRNVLHHTHDRDVTGRSPTRRRHRGCVHRSDVLISSSPSPQVSVWRTRTGDASVSSRGCLQACSPPRSCSVRTPTRWRATGCGST